MSDNTKVESSALLVTPFGDVTLSGSAAALRWAEELARKMKGPAVPAVAVPDEYVLAPAGATPEMIEAAEGVEDLYRRGTPGTWATVYRRMLAAAPCASQSAVSEPQAALPRKDEAQPFALPDELPAAVLEAAAEVIGGSAYDCIRVWSAWSHGTMGPDDFVPLADDGDRVAEIARAVLMAWGVPAVAVPDEMPTDRADWTCGQWTEHFGGRHQGGNPLNYYEFGSLWAVAKMMRSFGLVQRRIGWNACRAAMMGGLNAPSAKCDGNHGGPRCSDPECWNDGVNDAGN